MRGAATFVLLLGACQAAEAGDFTQPLKDCVAASVPAGHKVSAVRAREVLQSCQPHVRAFAFASTKQAYGDRFDPGSRQVRRDYRDRKRAIEEAALSTMSDEIRPSLRM